MRGWRRVGLEGYCEKHHIIPRCLKGGNEATNIVRLTAEEHFVAHLLLTKMYPDKGRLASAVFLMSTRCNKEKVKNNKFYGELKRRSALTISLANKGRIPWNKDGTHSEESRKKMSESGKKRAPISEETRAKLSARTVWNRGIPMSAETKEKLSIINRGQVSWNKGNTTPEEVRKKISDSLKGNEPWNKNKSWSEEIKEKISSACRGRKVTDETKAKISSANKGKTLSQEAKEHLSRVNTGKKHSQETKDKLSAYMKGAKSPMEGKKHSEETRAKMSASHKLRCQKAKDKKEILQLWCAL